MLKLKESWITPVEQELNSIFWELFFLPIMDIIQESKENKANSYLISRIRSGKIIYQDGVFSGEFNISASRELSRFATFDGRSGTWIGLPPGDVLAAATVANQRRQNMYTRIESAITDIEARAMDPELLYRFPIEPAFIEMDEQLKKDFRSVGVTPEFTQVMRDNITAEYNRNQNLNIKNWSTEQTERMRDFVSRALVKGVNRRGLIDMFQSEWGVTQNKARFLARQETSLFLSSLRRNRSLDAGIRKYRWSTSLDRRVRPANESERKSGENHRRLHGEIFEYGNPPIVNVKTGRRAEPGEDFNCRCVAIPVVA